MKGFLRVWFALTIALLAPAARGAAASTPAGTIISNTASAVYSDRNGVSGSVASNTVSATVATVSSVGAGPNEQGCNPATDSVPAGSTFVRTFTVSNGGNSADAFVITASTTAGAVSSLAVVGPGGTLTPLSNGGTLPNLASAGTLAIAVTVNPGATSGGTNVEVSLTATSTLPGAVASRAQQCAVLADEAAISGPGGANTPVLKLVNGMNSVAAEPGATLTYSVQFMNSGTSAVSNAVMTDALPAGTTPAAASVTIDGVAAPANTVSVKGQTLAVTIASIAGGAQEVIAFTASVDASSERGTTVVNSVSIASAQTATQQSTPASVLIGASNIVYDGLGGQSLPVQNATLSLTDAAGNPVLLGGNALAPNMKNSNPFVTGASGAYSFALGQKQIGPATYSLSIAAPGYLNRRVAVKVTPSASGTLYTATITALDGQMLATAGGFALTKSAMTLANVYGLFGNLPLFRPQNITVGKIVDRSFAAPGDRLVYTVTFVNAASPLGATSVVDTLPAGVVYAPGTGRLDNVPEEPKTAGRVLTWTLPTLATQHVIEYAAVIVPGTQERQVLTNDVTVRASTPNEPALIVSGSASVQTEIVAGVFSDGTIVAGRVFYDVRGTGTFRRGDAGIAGVRIYLEDGQSVVTDSTGRYDFPSVRPGMHVLELDLTTLPSSAQAYTDTNFSSDDQRSVRRLVHGVFDGGVIEDINFALKGTP